MRQVFHRGHARRGGLPGGGNHTRRHRRPKPGLHRCRSRSWLGQARGICSVGSVATEQNLVGTTDARLRVDLPASSCHEGPGERFQESRLITARPILTSTSQKLDSKADPRHRAVGPVVGVRSSSRLAQLSRSRVGQDRRGVDEESEARELLLPVRSFRRCCP